MKKIIITLSLLVAAIVLFLVYKNFLKPIETKEIHDSVGSQWLRENKKKTYIEEKDWYKLKVEYPENNKLVSDKIFEQMENFAKENEIRKYKTKEEAASDFGVAAESAGITFIGEYTIATSTDSLTYVYQIYTFSGGAHGSTTILPITLDAKGNLVTADQILPNEKLEKISKICAEDIKKQKLLRFKEFGMSQKEIVEAQKSDSFLTEGTKPTRDNFNTVWYEGDEVVVLFGQYQVGSYAEGMFEVRIPKSAI